MIAAIAIAACGHGTAEHDPPPPAQLRIVPEQVRVRPGSSVRFEATSGNRTASVAWSCDGGSVDGDGSWTAPMTEGTFHVVATSPMDSAVRAVATAVVSPDIHIAITPDHVTLTAGGKPFQFKTTVTGSSDTAVAWSIEEPSDGSSIEASGTFMPPSSPGTFHIVATSHADSTRSATAVATVSNPTGATVVISPQSTTVAPLATVRFTANVPVTWSADGGSIQHDGSWIAPQAAGDYHVTARSLADSSQAATAAATVVQQQIQISIEPAHVTEGQYGPPIQFTAHVTGTADSRVDWSIAPPKGKNTIDANGLFTSGGDAGWFQIVATSRADPSKKATADVLFKMMLWDGGGPIEPHTRTFVLWWGDPQAFAPDARPALEAFLTGLNGSSYLALVDQYMRGAKTTTIFGGSFIDTSAPEVGNAVDALCRTIDANGIALQNGDIFFVNTSNFPENSACAWHSFASGACHGRTILFAYIPNPALGCNHRSDGCGSGYSNPALATRILAGHELIETITDPLGTAWLWAEQQEVVDLCGELVCVALTDGKSYELQNIYSNAALSCVSH